ncbi:hypothetical protein MM440_07885 [Arsenicicoccus piscis]|uniref:hypothetical protein n=1 Tax=Arsenicicoccus piscis TaxID=673954 RepID=UPI001F4CDD0C|nr:hypothetical protein [Arsenicicoccus piscis]MCH8627706.1 hypothetical protein [Arsenicicoccus piscis]
MADTALDQRPEHQRQAARPSWVVRPAAAFVGPLCVVLVLAALVALWTAGAVPALTQPIVLGYLVLGVLLPGIAVHRSLRGVQRTWAADLTLGGVTGLALQLAAWLLYSLAHAQSLLWTWPIVVLAVVAVLPTRRRVLARPPERWSALMTASVTVAIGMQLLHLFRSTVARYPLTDPAAQVYMDLFWHMGLIHEAKREFPLIAPQAIDSGPVLYHWFSDADMAATSLVTGATVPDLVITLWPAYLSVLAIVSIAALAQHVSRRRSSVPVAAALAAVTITIGPMTDWARTHDYLTALSPSQVYSVPILVGVVMVLTSILRGERRPGTWAALVLVSLAMAGAKASAPGTVAAGLALALLATLFLRRQRLLVGGLLLGYLAESYLASKLVAGGSGGSGLQLLSVVSLTGSYRAVNPGYHFSDSTGPVLDLLVSGTPVGPLFLLGALTLVVLILCRVLLGVAPLVEPRLRRDPVAWLLCGICGSATAAVLLIAHAGYSELYFAYGATPFGIVAGAWWLGELIDGDARAARFAGAWALVGAALAGAFDWVQVPTGGESPETRVLTAYVALAVAGLLLALWFAVVAWRRNRRSARHRDAGRRAALIALSIWVGSIAVSGPWMAVTEPVAQPTRTDTTAAVATASAWIRDNTPRDALFTSNWHCETYEAVQCPSRVWWASGLAGRRMLIEGWSYTPQSAHAPFFDPALLEINQRAYILPNEADLDVLRGRGVEYLVAIKNPTHYVSPQLATLTDKVYDNGVIAVYRIR